MSEMGRWSGGGFEGEAVSRPTRSGLKFSETTVQNSDFHRVVVETGGG